MSGRCLGLDALRAISALIVAWHHLHDWYFLSGPTTAAASAVDLFMVISGFVMARTYDFRVLSIRAFLNIRLRRLFPIMAIGTSIGAAAILIDSGPSVPLAIVYISTLLFLPIGFFAVNVSTWSIFSEIFANFLHALLLSHLNGRNLLYLAGTLWLGFVVSTLAVGGVAWGSDLLSLGIATLRCLYCYTAGIVIFRRYGDTPLGSWPRMALFATGALLFFGAAIPPVIFSIGFASVAAPLLIRASLGLRRYSAVAAFGAMSFPLYAAHVPVIMLSQTIGLGPSFAAIAAFGVAIGLSMVEAKRRPEERSSRSAHIACIAPAMLE